MSLPDSLLIITAYCMDADKVVINPYPDPRNRLVRTMLRWCKHFDTVEDQYLRASPSIGEKEADSERMVAKVASFLPIKLIWRKCQDQQDDALG